MAYYMRSNDAHDDSRYMMHGLGTALNNAWGNLKGSWSKPVKYVDKRIVNGRMKYLYPEMLEKARQAGQAAKDSFKKTADDARNSYNKIKKSVSDFRNYSKDVNSRADRAEEDLRRRESRIDTNNKLFDKNDAAYEKNTDTFNKAQTEARNYQDQLKLIEETYGKNSEQYRVMKEDLDRVDNFINELDKEAWQLDARENELREARKANADALEKSYETMNQANAEKDTFKYKASRFLDNLLRGNIDPYTQAGANWLKNQLEAGNQWAINVASSAANTASNISNSVENLLGEFTQSANTALSNGATYLQNVFSFKPAAPLENNTNGPVYQMQENGNFEKVDNPPPMQQPTVVKPQRTYSGTSQKAEKQGEGLNVTQQDVDQAWQRVQQARMEAGWKQGPNGAYGPSTPEVQAAMEEYLKLRERQNGPVGSANGYSGRPGK